MFRGHLLNNFEKTGKDGCLPFSVRAHTDHKQFISSLASRVLLFCFGFYCCSSYFLLRLAFCCSYPVRWYEVMGSLFAFLLLW